MEIKIQKKQAPYFVMADNNKIPVIGFGPGFINLKSVSQRILLFKFFYSILFVIKFKIKQLKFIRAVTHALNVGYILLDNSSSYSNSKLIKLAILFSKKRRQDLFLTTRISNRAQMTRQVREELFQQLTDTGVHYFDLVQIHWPVTGYYVQTWKDLIQLQKEGYIKTIGVANFHPHHIDQLIAETGVVPIVNQIEVHPLLTQKDIIKYCKEKNIIVQAYTPIARYDERLVRLPILQKIARKYNKTLAQIILRWHIQNGIIPIIRSFNNKRQKENLKIFDFNLTEEEMIVIDGININSRLRYDPDNCDFSIL